MEIYVENIKCGGCANGIKKQLEKLAEVVRIEVDVEAGKVSLEMQGDDAEAARQQICDVLLKMGYPEVGSVEGLKAAGAKAKSFVSCAVGKVTQD